MQKLNLFDQRRNLLLFMILIIFLSILSIVVAFGVTEGIDKSVTKYVVKNINDSFQESMKVITYMGDYHVLVPLTFIVLLYFYRNEFYETLFSFLVLMVGVVPIYKILKFLFSRERPMFDIFTTAGYSFPSGHATAAFVFYIGFYIFYYIVEKKENNWIVLSILSIISIMIAYSRVILGVHYLTDIIGGFLVGASWVVLIAILKQSWFVEIVSKIQFKLTSA